MIAKIIPRKKHQKAGFAYSTRYMLGAVGGSDPLSWERTAEYILKTHGEGLDRVASWRVTNCDNEDPGDATAEILNTQSMNTRAKSARHLHVVASFPAGENPDEQALHAIEDDLVQALGLEEHQRISAVHVDTDHLHIHIVISKIHPQTYKIASPVRSKKKLMEACHDIEIKYGLEKVNHGLEKESLRDQAEAFAELEPELVSAALLAQAIAGAAAAAESTAVGEGVDEGENSELQESDKPFCRAFTERGLGVEVDRESVTVVDLATGERTSLEGEAESATRSAWVASGAPRSRTEVLGEPERTEALAASRVARHRVALAIVSGEARAARVAAAKEAHLVAGEEGLLWESAAAAAAALIGAADSSEAREELADWINEIPGEEIAMLIGRPAGETSWEELHRRLAQSDLALKPKGAGLVFVAGDGTTAKASVVKREWSMAALTEKLGEYEPAGESALDVETREIFAAAGSAPLAASWEDFYRGFVERGFRVDIGSDGLVAMPAEKKAENQEEGYPLPDAMSLESLVRVLGRYQSASSTVDRLLDEPDMAAKIEEKKEAARDALEAAQGPAKLGDIESKSGQKSLVDWAQKTVKQEAQGMLSRAGKGSGQAGWEDFHHLLALYDLSIRPRGAGLALVAGKAGIGMKASDLGREFSKESLEKAFGDFVMPSAAIRAIEPEESFERQPAIGKQATGLWAEYQKQQSEVQKKKAVAWDTYKKARDAVYATFEFRADRIKHGKSRGAHRKRLFDDMKFDRAQALKPLERKMQADKDAQKPKTWLAFLTEEAAAGNTEAIASLGRYREKVNNYAFSIQAAAPGHFSSVVMEGMRKGKESKSGATRYYAPDGGIFSSTPKGIDLVVSSDLALAGIVGLANERYPDIALKLKGPPEFQTKIKQIAAEKKLGLDFKRDHGDKGKKEAHWSANN